MSKSLLLAVPILAVALAGCTQSSSGTQIGDPAPLFTVETIDDVTFRLEDQRGSVVLVDLMGVNCAPCRREAQELVDVRAEFNRSELVMISVDRGSDIGSLGAQSEQDIRDFVEEFNATWHFAPDTDDVGQRYQIIGLPTIYIIDADGIIRFKHGGVATAEDIGAAVRDAGS